MWVGFFEACFGQFGPYCFLQPRLSEAIKDTRAFLVPTTGGAVSIRSNARPLRWLITTMSAHGSPGGLTACRASIISTPYQVSHRFRGAVCSMPAIQTLLHIVLLNSIAMLTILSNCNGVGMNLKFFTDIFYGKPFRSHFLPL